MTTAEHPAYAPTSARKPDDQEIDVYGLTHPGKVRQTNEDHFLICSLRKQLTVHLTSLPDTESLTRGPERLAFLAMVADGVGGGAMGEEASRLALEAIMEYVNHATACFYNADTKDDEVFANALREAAMASHAHLLQRAETDPDAHGMATTLTLWLGLWPRAYLLQVGDSRCYQLHGGELRQISRDQTMAQELVDLGVLAKADASRTPWAHTLSSAIGGEQTAPVVTRMDQEWGNVGLLCSDGLTRHVSDERIRERLLAMTSAKQACEALLQDALDAGGRDNITILVGCTGARESGTT
ncbi:MAG TPA: protein phosphatase 2C domain-containing protein [Gemmatimonadaceae bacterium]|nr:protein phosphatase 2C domain-containing protein [Gemmatimonadaceae bacterium]